MLCVPVLVDLVNLCRSFASHSDSQDVWRTFATLALKSPRLRLCQIWDPPSPLHISPFFNINLMSNIGSNIGKVAREIAVAAAIVSYLGAERVGMQHLRNGYRVQQSFAIVYWLNALNSIYK